MTQAEELLIEEQQLRSTYWRRMARAEALLRRIADKPCKCDALFTTRDRHVPGSVCDVRDEARAVLAHAERGHDVEGP